MSIKAKACSGYVGLENRVVEVVSDIFLSSLQLWHCEYRNGILYIVDVKDRELFGLVMVRCAYLVL
jgi:hypothetical protein